MTKITHDWYLDEYINENWVYADNVFSKDECTKIINLFSSKLVQGTIGNNDKLKEIRQSKVHLIESSNKDNQWVFQRLVSVITQLNSQFFKYDLEKIETLQFSEYDESYKGFYEKHIDMMHQSVGFRKLSFTVLLSDPKDYNGGELVLHFDKDPSFTRQEQGGIVVFPSYSLHEVKPVTKGTRYALVGWVWGPRFK